MIGYMLTIHTFDHSQSHFSPRQVEEEIVKGLNVRRGGAAGWGSKVLELDIWKGLVNLP